MTTTTLPNVTLTTQANVYFDGKCVSHSFTLADGTKKSVGGGCEYKLAGSDEWKSSGPGERFSIPANSSFDIRVAEQYHYICHYG